MDISLLLATYRRNDTLKTTLTSLTRLDTENLAWHVLVADNDCSSETETLVKSFGNRLPIHYIPAPKPGKNNALMTALPCATGDLIVLTDDDIIASSDWLQEYKRCADRLNQYSIFGGRILPHFPKNCAIDSRIPLKHDFTTASYALTTWDEIEGPTKPSRIWGPNMAVRREVFEKGLNFNPNVGPHGTNYVMGSETEFLLRASEAGFAMAYLPSVVVHHQIREEQLHLDWFRGRAFRSGRARTVVYREFDKFNKVFGAPLFVWRKCFLAGLKYRGLRVSGKKDAAFTALIEYEQLRGAIAEMRRESKAPNVGGI